MVTLSKVHDKVMFLSILFVGIGQLALAVQSFNAR